MEKLYEIYYMKFMRENEKENYNKALLDGYDKICEELYQIIKNK